MTDKKASKNPLTRPVDSRVEGKDFAFTITESTIGVHRFEIQIWDKDTGEAKGTCTCDIDVAASIIGVKAPAVPQDPNT